MCFVCLNKHNKHSLRGAETVPMKSVRHQDSPSEQFFFSFLINEKKSRVRLWALIGCGLHLNDSNGLSPV